VINERDKVSREKTEQTEGPDEVGEAAREHRPDEVGQSPEKSVKAVLTRKRPRI
jgi:hypothetical protein